MFQQRSCIFRESADTKDRFKSNTYEACPESRDSKVLNVYNIFNLQKRHCEWIAWT
jgi:hypothetical protein